jgi:hypothetical protein
MSKSGLLAHFRSKRVLELATINEARKIFISQVLAPATVGNESIERLWILCDSRLSHIERRVIPGGYFLREPFSNVRRDPERSRRKSTPWRENGGTV